MIIIEALPAVCREPWFDYFLRHDSWIWEFSYCDPWILLMVVTMIWPFFAPWSVTNCIFKPWFVNFWIFFTIIAKIHFSDKFPLKYRESWIFYFYDRESWIRGFSLPLSVIWRFPGFSNQDIPPILRFWLLVFFSKISSPPPPFYSDPTIKP